MNRAVLFLFLETIPPENELNIEIEETKKKRNGYLDSNGFEKEIEGTIRLLEIIKYNPEIMDTYDENLLTHTVDQVIIGQNKTITFKLINGLKLTEHISKGGEDA